MLNELDLSLLAPEDAAIKFYQNQQTARATTDRQANVGGVA